jgi:hypothetical protein
VSAVHGANLAKRRNTPRTERRHGIQPKGMPGTGRGLFREDGDEFDLENVAREEEAVDLDPGSIWVV